MKRVAEDEPIVGIPPVLRVRIVRVQPPFVAIALHVEDVRIAVGISDKYATPSMPPAIDESPACIVYSIVMLQRSVPSIFTF